jgi:hypothetical protein
VLDCLRKQGAPGAGEACRLGRSNFGANLPKPRIEDRDKPVRLSENAADRRPDLFSGIEFCVSVVRFAVLELCKGVAICVEGSTNRACTVFLRYRRATRKRRLRAYATGRNTAKQWLERSNG